MRGDGGGMIQARSLSRSLARGCLEQRLSLLPIFEGLTRRGAEVFLPVRIGFSKGGGKNRGEWAKRAEGLDNFAI